MTNPLMIEVPWQSYISVHVVRFGLALLKRDVLYSFDKAVSSHFYMLTTRCAPGADIRSTNEHSISVRLLSCLSIENLFLDVTLCHIPVFNMPL